MKLVDILNAANDAYGDGTMGGFYYPADGTINYDYTMGDNLARSIAIKLAETYRANDTTEDQLAEARRVMQTALDDIQRVLESIDVLRGGDGVT